MFKDEPETKPYSHIVFTSTCRSVLQTFGCYSMNFFFCRKMYRGFSKVWQTKSIEGFQVPFSLQFWELYTLPQKDRKASPVKFKRVRLAFWSPTTYQMVIFSQTKNGFVFHPKPSVSGWMMDRQWSSGPKGPYLWNPWWMTGIHG